MCPFLIQCYARSTRARGWAGQRDGDFDMTGSSVQSSDLTIILILSIALVTGVILQSRWALLVPLGLGITAAFAIAATGHPLGDTPIPFLVVVSTLSHGWRPRIAIAPYPSTD